MRHIEPKDLEKIDEIMKIDNFDVGLSNLTTYYNCSNTALWWCTENENGEIVAVDISNTMPNGIVYGFALSVRPEYRGKGISNLFTSHWKDYPKIGSMTLKSVQILSNNFECWQGKMLTMFGKVETKLTREYAVANEATADIQFETIKEENIYKIFAYDVAIIKLDRQMFLKQWCCNKDAIAYCALRHGSCVGFGVLKKFNGYQGISPLYADDDRVASALFAKLIEHLKGGFLYVPAQSHQRATMEFCSRLKLNFTSSELINSARPALSFLKTIKTEKVFTSHDYWPV